MRILIVVLLCACAHGSSSGNQKPATVGDFLQAQCDSGDGQACEILAGATEKEDPTRAAALRDKACSLGRKSACKTTP